MPRKNHVCLSPADRRKLERTVRTGRHHARTIAHARILLLADESADGPSWTDRQVAQALGCAVSTVENVRRRYVREGLQAALRARRSTRHRPRRLSDDACAYLVRLSRSAPPSGHDRWSLRLLTDRFVTQAQARGLLDRPVSHETIRLALKRYVPPGRVQAPEGAPS